VKKRGLGIRSALVVSIAALTIAAASGIIPFRQIITRQQAVDLAAEQRDALVEENLRLEAQVAALRTPAEVERLAREHFGLVLPGEIAYVAVPAEDPEMTALPEEPIPVLVEPTPWWRSLWDFVTGGDLVDE
jgi:cell division protein FtsB